MDDTYRAGIFVLALIHAKKIHITCTDCNDRQKEFFKCKGPSEEPVFSEDDYEFYNCPLNWLIPEIYDWWDEVQYYESFPGSAPKYGDHSPRFWEAYKFYKSVYNKYAYESPKDKSTDDSLKTLRANFRKR